MRVYTSYYAKLSKIPESFYPIAISCTVPDGINIPRYVSLAPPYSILSRYKEDKDSTAYEVEYRETVLSHLEKDKVLRQLERMSGGKDVVLMCYERSDSFCHRHIVASWIGAEELML